MSNTYKYIVHKRITILHIKQYFFVVGVFLVV
jgi:hypothetical protein